jgi:hypothetical protein
MCSGWSLSTNFAGRCSPTSRKLATNFACRESLRPHLALLQSVGDFSVGRSHSYSNLLELRKRISGCPRLLGSIAAG